MAPLKPGTKLPPQKQRRNERERRRVNTMNQMYDRLRERVTHGGNKKMSKVDTVKEAARYIRYLQDILQQADFQEMMPGGYPFAAGPFGDSPPPMYGQPGKMEPIAFSPSGSPCPSSQYPLGQPMMQPPPPFAPFSPFQQRFSPLPGPWKIESEGELPYASCSPTNTSTSSSNTSFSPQQHGQPGPKFANMSNTSCQYAQNHESLRPSH